MTLVLHRPIRHLAVCGNPVCKPLAHRRDVFLAAATSVLFHFASHSGAVREKRRAGITARWRMSSAPCRSPGCMLADNFRGLATGPSAPPAGHPAAAVQSAIDVERGTYGPRSALWDGHVALCGLRRPDR